VIDVMPRPRWPHLLREVSRHGTVSWTVRVGHGPRTRLRAPYGSREFEAQYHAVIRGEPAGDSRRAGVGTLRWLWDRHRDSSAWASLSNATRRQRENIMHHVLASAGAEPFAAITKATIIAGRERRKATPSQANNFLNTMRSLFKWAIENALIASDPTAGVKDVRRPKSGGFRMWTEEEIARFEKRWPVGTRERLALIIFLCTGLRRGDAAVLGRQHISGGVIQLRTEKTGERIVIPVLPELAEAIAATKIGDLSFIAKDGGAPMTKESLGNWFKDACRAAGVPGSAHGLRKAGATRAANNGATVAQLEAIFGWKGGRMASLYTEQADRVRLAREAIEKMTKSGTVYSQPNDKVRDRP
jgi:integrase